MIILDTNVVSEPLKRIPDPNLIRWLSRQTPETLYITAITKAELLAGFEKMPEGARREALGLALNTRVLALFEGRILSFDSAASEQCSKLLIRANRGGNSISFPDAAIAAIALSSGYLLATRNVGDFVETGVRLINPWTGAD